MLNLKNTMLELSKRTGTIVISTKVAILGVFVTLGMAGNSALANVECSLDGEPLSGEVRFFSSGGTYGESLEKAFFIPFEEECGVKVIPVSSKRTFQQLLEMRDAGHYQYDVGSSNGREFPLGIEEGLYAKLPDNFWDELDGVMIEAGTSDYGAWNTTYSQVVAYSTERVAEGFGDNGWADLWDVEKFPGKRALYDSPYSLVFALIADGVAPEDIYPLDYDRAFAKLDEIKPHVLFWWKKGDQPVQGILNGEVVAASAWNGRVSSRVFAGEPIANSWKNHFFMNGWNVVMAGSPNERNAIALLHYMQNAKGQAKQAELTQYLGANKAAFDLLKPEIAGALASAHLSVDMAHVVYSPEWWTPNGQEAQNRWNEWRAE